MNPNTWKRIDDDFADVERLAGRRLTRALVLPTDDEIARAALELGCTFVDDYVTFLRRYGGATVGGSEIYGLRPVEGMGVEWSVVMVTQRFRQDRFPGTEDWYVISDDGYGNPIGIARDGRVMISDHDTGTISVLENSFEEFLVNWCLQKSAE